MKSKKKKFLSGIAALVTLFGANPKSNVQAIKPTTKNTIKNTIVNIAVPTSVIGTIGTAIGLPIYFACKSEREQRQREEEKKKKTLKERDDALSKSDDYIKNLATDLKEIIPWQNQKLFDALIQCNSNEQLVEWQYKVVKNAEELNSKSLGKIIDALYHHWFNINQDANKTKNILCQLYNKLNDKKQEEHRKMMENHNKEMERIAKEKLEIEKRKLNDQIYKINK